MSRRSKPAAASRRTRRAGEPAPQLPVFAGSSGIMSTTNPIFHREAGLPGQPSPPPADRDQLRCVYGPGSVRVLVHNPAAASGGLGKPLPPPPCRTHRAGPAGARVSGVRVGPALVVGGPRGRGMRRAAQDPFLAAYVACSRGGGGAHVKRPEQQEEKKETTATTRKKGKGGEVVRGCGVWNGWAYAGAMSCRSGCAVDALAADAPAAAAAKAKAAAESEESEVPTLDLSWAPAVLSARSLERRREQR